MAALRAHEKNRLLSYSGFKSFVEKKDKITVYKNFVVEWRKNNKDNKKLLDLEFIAKNLSNYLHFYDPDLPELMRSTLGNANDTDHQEFYLLIARYFVDLVDSKI